MLLAKLIHYLVDLLPQKRIRRLRLRIGSGRNMIVRPSKESRLFEESVGNVEAAYYQRLETFAGLEFLLGVFAGSKWYVIRSTHPDFERIASAIEHFWGGECSLNTFLAENSDYKKLFGKEFGEVDDYFVVDP